MSLFDRIQNLFRRENLDDDPALATYDDLEPQVEETKSTPVPEVIAAKPTREFPLEGAADPLASPVRATQTDWAAQYAWLEDEGLLRDEGVIFGLSASKSEEKIGIIRSYFTHQAADLEREVEHYSERIQELNLFIEQRETRINDLKTKATDLDNRQIEGEHQLPRTVAGLIFSTIMCIGNYFLIEDTLRPLYPNSSWIAVGVFLAGMFNLFGRVSFFHESGTSVSWRRLTEEVGMPLAAALFVFVQAYQNQPLLRAVSLFGFVFFLFMFSGKLLLSNLTVLRNDLAIWTGGKSLSQEKNTKSQDWEGETLELEAQIDDLRVKKWQILPDLNRAEAELTRLHARRDTMIKLFESEFLLARQIRDRLTERQLRDITRRFE